MSKATRSLNLALVARSERIGFCALQVGHQGALISTRIGFPAAWAASNALISKGCIWNAWAGTMAVALAPTIAACSRKRLEIIVCPHVCSDCGTCSTLILFAQEAPAVTQEQQFSHSINN